MERYQHLAICVHNNFSGCFLSQDRRCSVRLGELSALLPVLQHTFLNFSRHVNQDLVFHGYEVRLLHLLNSKGYSQYMVPLLTSSLAQLRGKSKARFVETAFKAIREHYSLKPVLTVAQFLDRVSGLWLGCHILCRASQLVLVPTLSCLQGFAERKVMLLHDLICKCVSFHNEAVRLQRIANATFQVACSRVECSMHNFAQLVGVDPYRMITLSPAGKQESRCLPG